MGLKPLLLVGVGVLGVGVLLQIVAMATPNWTVGKVDANKLGLGNLPNLGINLKIDLPDVEIGPWRSCPLVNSNVLNKVLSKGSNKLSKTCGYVDTGSGGKTDAVRAMSLLGVLLGIASAGAAMLTLVIGILGKDEIKLLPMIAGAAGIGAAGLTFLGLVIWAADLGGLTLGYSWGLSFVAMVFFAAGGVLTFIGGR